MMLAVGKEMRVVTECEVREAQWWLWNRTRTVEVAQFQLIDAILSDYAKELHARSGHEPQPGTVDVRQRLR